MGFSSIRLISNVQEIYFYPIDIIMILQGQAFLDLSQAQGQGIVKHVPGITSEAHRFAKIIWNKLVTLILPSFPPAAELNRHAFPDGQQMDHITMEGACSRPAARGLICVELDEGGTSDLTDCVIPSLGGFQSNWTAGLFTVNRSGQSSFHIGFDFSRPVNFTRVELDLFNCPEWGIAAQTITVYEYTFGILIFCCCSKSSRTHNSKYHILYLHCKCCHSSGASSEFNSLICH